MKKTLIALMALAGVAAAADTITEDTTLYKGGDLYSAAFDYTFTLSEDFAVTGDYDLLLAYYQVNDGRGYSVNAFKLSSTGILTLDRGNTLSLTDEALTSDSTLTTQDASTFTAVGGGSYALTLPGTYTIQYLGGGNGEAAANLLLDGAVVASFTKGSHNMNGAENGTAIFQAGNIFYKVNDSYAPVSVPEPTTATLSLLALAGLAARRRRK